MNKIMLFAGTIEGRQLCEFLQEEEKEAVVYVATEYGEEILDSLNSRLEVIKGRKNQSDILEEIEKQKPKVIIDATHPYAVIVSENIKSASVIKNIPYIRVMRESLNTENLIKMDKIEDIVSYLNHQEGNVLVTTGSKEIQYFTEVNSYKERIFARILPDAKAVSQCVSLGIKGKNLICMQGPFSKELNYTLLKEFHIRYLVTKESGSQGGFLEKINAAKEADVKVMVLNRPIAEKGYSLEEIKRMIRKGEVWEA